MAWARGVMTSGVMASGATAGDLRPASTVFFGGGTPTMLDPAALARLLGGVRETWGVAPGAEVTTEANPDSVDAAALAALADGGLHPGELRDAVGRSARARDPRSDPRPGERRAGGRAGRRTRDSPPRSTSSTERRARPSTTGARPSTPRSRSPPTTSAPTRSSSSRGRAWAPQLRRGEVAPVDPDLQAEMYEAADDAFAAAGYSWYEVSNWARTPGDACRHNVGYWRGQDWWGIGPGAHSYLETPERRRAAVVERQAPPRVRGAARGGRVARGGRRGPDRRAALRGAGHARDSARRGAPVSRTLRPAGRARARRPRGATGSSRAQRGAGPRSARRAPGQDSVVLTRRGRLLADAVIRELAWAASALARSSASSSGSGSTRHGSRRCAPGSGRPARG